MEEMRVKFGWRVKFPFRMPEKIFVSLDLSQRVTLYEMREEANANNVEKRKIMRVM